ncbi:hypothetical protein [Sphingosinicella rhizophila]|uniref:Major facilitator superfamily (MFS) profile domain-containing protein n=1 Tax=Sphingosinicella rhizophila TaxID=3050082 RepID=A0ABU3QAJ2_9SPHN|nr:hypothetical protein [Sphingosinicella sp. GR2756]MDT9600425.1 hypothetical protein [Sphingosinicella sp. GR2756]
MAIVTLFGFFAFMCWAVFNLTVYAVPAFVGFSAGLFAYQTGAGIVGAVLVGLAAAAVTLGASQRLFAIARSRRARLLLALAFATPAAFAGYHAGLGIAGTSIDSAVWRQLVALLGSALVGATAASRLAGGTGLGSSSARA